MALTSGTIKVRMTFHLSSQTYTEVLQDLNSSTSYFSSLLQRHYFQDAILPKMHMNVQDKQDEGTKYSTFSFLLSLHLQLGYCYRYYVYYEGECVNYHCHIISTLPTTGWHQIKWKNLLHAQIFSASNLKRFMGVVKGKPGSDSDTVRGSFNIYEFYLKNLYEERAKIWVFLIAAGFCSFTILWFMLW